MPTAEDMKKKIEAYFEALERFDLEAAADCFTDDVFYSHPPYSGEGSRHEVRGRARLIGLFEERGHKPDVKHDVQLAALDGLEGAVGGTFTSGGVTGSFLSTVTMSPDGRIASYAAYASVPAVGAALAEDEGRVSVG